MASTYSTNLAIELIGTGDQAGTWGVTTNTNLGTLIEQAISGYVTQAVATGTDTTITIPNGATGVARNMYIELTGTGGALTNLIVPANKKLYFIFNNSTGAVTVKVSGQTGVSVAQGAKVILVSNGTDIVNATDYLRGDSANITVLTSSSATITNLLATTAQFGSASISNADILSAVITGATITSSNITTLTGTTVSYGSASITNVRIGTSATIARFNAGSSAVSNLLASGAITAVGNISTSGNLSASGSITASSGSITQLTSTSATITTLKATSATIDNVSFTSIVLTNATITSANITTLTGTTVGYASASVTNVNISDSATIGRFSAGSSAVSNLLASGAITAVGDISSSGNISASGSITGSSGVITQFNSTSATITTLTGTSSTITTIAATSASITGLSSTSANITTLTGTTVGYASASITTITGTTIGTTASATIRGVSGVIGQFNSTSATITTLTGTTLGYGSASLTNFKAVSAVITSASVTGLGVTSAAITNLTGTTVSYTSGSITGLSVTSAQITTLTGNTLGYASGSVTAISGTNLTFTSGTVTTLAGTSADITTITGATIGTTASATIRGVSGSIAQFSATSATIDNLTVTSFNVGQTSFTSATITNLNSTSANITTLTGTTLTYGSGSITTLTGSSMNVTTATFTSSNITTLTGTSANITTITGTTIGTTASATILGVSGNIAQFTATSSTITTLTGTTVGYGSASLTNLKAVSAVITSATVTGLGVTSAAITTLTGTTLTYTSGTITGLSSTSAALGKFTAGSSAVSNFLASGTITAIGNISTSGNLSASGSITASSGSITQLTSTSSTITTLTGTTLGYGSASLSNLKAVSAVITSATVTGLGVTSAAITTLTGTTLGYGSASLSNLKAVSAVITSATVTGLGVTSAAITTLTGTTLGYASASVTNINIATSATIGRFNAGSSAVSNLFASGTIVTAGNVGVGTTLSAWTLFDVAQVENASVAGYLGRAYLSANWFYDGTDKYITADTATQYRQISGQHQWFNAATGTVGGTISFTQAMTLTSAGDLIVGNTTANGKLDVYKGISYNADAALYSAIGVNDSAVDNNKVYYWRTGLTGSATGQNYVFQTLARTEGSWVERMRLDSSGNLGLGVTPSAWSAYKAFQMQAGSLISFSTNDWRMVQNVVRTGTTLDYLNNGFANMYLQDGSVGGHIWYTAGSGTAGGTISFTQAMTLNASGELLIGTASSDGSRLRVYGSYQTLGDGTYEGLIGKASSLVSGGGTGDFAVRSAANLVFATNGNTERARITSDGTVLVAKTTDGTNTVGVTLAPTGFGRFVASAETVMGVNRATNDGTIISLQQDAAEEGSISVSGNTVSYNAFAGSHWSQLQDGSKPDILRGTVMESINELCVWPNEQNERLPKAKISDTAGSKKVYGVFMTWDNDWTATNDMLVTAVGAFICRVNASVTVQEGDLLESNGDGTARVQADDIIRSSTIGKVTSTVKTHQYADGSYCVPTVLYCG